MSRENWKLVKAAAMDAGVIAFGVIGILASLVRQAIRERWGR